MTSLYKPLGINTTLFVPRLPTRPRLTDNGKEAVADVHQRRRRRRAVAEETERSGRHIRRRRRGSAEPAEGRPEDAKPIGEIVKVSGKGRSRKTHYRSFELEGIEFNIEDSVLLSPEDSCQKPYVAIIKDITQALDGTMIVTGQWFYCPEEAEKKGGGSWEPRDSRELFHSFHFDDVPAESVMHKCVVHFIPLHKKLQLRTQHPGFTVQKVYDVVDKKLRKLTDKMHENDRQNEIDYLIQKTVDRSGELPDIDSKDACADHADRMTVKRNLRRTYMHPPDALRDAIKRPEHITKGETHESFTSDVSDYHVILSKFEAFTGCSRRDKWLEKLLEGIQEVCNSENTKGSSASSDLSLNSNYAATVANSMDKSLDDGERILWPDAAVQAITALERASHETLGSDFQRYNKKMRQLVFNLKRTLLLAKRLLNKELEPAVILNMSPNELKDGLTTSERIRKEPEESKQMQMIDSRCSRCMEKKVGITDVIQAGGHGIVTRFFIGLALLTGLELVNYSIF